MRDQFASILALVEDTVVQLYGDTRRAPESSPETIIMTVIRIVGKQSVAKAFRSFASQSTVKRAAQKCLAKPHNAYAMATRTIDLLALTVSVAKLVKNEVEKRTVEKAEVRRSEIYRIWKFWETRQKRETSSSHRTRTRRDPLFLRRAYPATKRRIQRRTVSWHLRMVRISAVMIAFDKRRGAVAVVAADITARQHFWYLSEIVPSPDSKFWYRSSRGTRRPLSIALIVSFTGIRGMIMT